MLARLDNLPQRHRSLIHAAAPDVDFRTSMRCERIPGRHDPCPRNFPSHACHAKPPAIGISLAEIAETARSWQRPARAGPTIGIMLAKIAETPAIVCPPGIATETRVGAERAERSETHFSPIAVRKYSWGRHWEKKWHDRRPARQLVGSLAGQRELEDVGSMMPTYSGRPWRSPASNQKIPNLFNAGKPQTPGNGAYLFRPSASQSSDRDAQVGMFEMKVLALHPAHERDGGSGGVSLGHPERSEGSHAFGKR